MRNKNSLKALLETNEKSYDVLINSNNFLDTKAYNLITAIGIIITIWFFSINYIITNSSATNLSNPVSFLGIPFPTKNIIIILSVIAAGCYVWSLCNILNSLKGRKFYRARLTEENIEKYGEKQEKEVYAMLACVIDENTSVLQDKNNDKSLLIDQGINLMMFGGILTIITVVITLWVV